MQRAQRFLNQLAPSVGADARSGPSTNDTVSFGGSRDDDVVVVSALRTAIGRARRGSFAQTNVEDLLAPVIKATVERTGIKPELIDDVVVGSVLGTGSQRHNECRIAAFLAGIPAEVPLSLTNRQCGSGLQAVAQVAAAIKSGLYDVGLACGVETMSQSKFAWEGTISPKVLAHEQAKACLVPMGITSENVAAKYGITRREQDEFAALSHKRAYEATKSGRFRDEIVPVDTVLKDPKTGEEHKLHVTKDDGIRPGTTPEKLAKLRTVFKQDGSTTAGNASQVSDGAAAVLLMRRRQAHELGLEVLGVFRHFAVVGVDPNVMGIGPAVAIPKVLQKAGLTLDDIDLFEINEAFASQAVYCAKKLGLLERDAATPGGILNPSGGAIAIGHPLGMTGARMTATLLHEMKKRGAKRGIVSACIGGGQGIAAIFERD